MHFGEIIVIIVLNGFLVACLFHIQKQSLDHELKHLRQEVQELENLVAAIIEEFEDVAGLNDDATKEEEHMTAEEPIVIQEGNPAIEVMNETGESQEDQQGIDARHEQILNLRQQGISVEEIARRLGTSRGEVQLILGIYRKV